MNYVIFLRVVYVLIRLILWDNNFIVLGELNKLFKVIGLIKLWRIIVMMIIINILCVLVFEFRKNIYLVVMVNSVGTFWTFVLCKLDVGFFEG